MSTKAADRWREAVDRLLVGGPARQLAGEGSRFLLVGALAALIDLAAYLAMTFVGLAPSMSKALSYVMGALFSFLGHRAFTFRRFAEARGFALFWGVYLASLGLNVAVNSSLLSLSKALGAPIAIRLGVAWFVATGMSAAANFIALKLVVFRGAPLPARGSRSAAR